MGDWNVIATSGEDRFGEAMRFLAQYGTAVKTPYYNVIKLMAHDVSGLMQVLANEWQAGGGLRSLNRVMPVSATFTFNDRRTLEQKASDIARAWAPQLSNKGFHVRMHRRGFKSRLSSVEEEQLLDKTVIDATTASGTPAHVTFEDPDAILALETIGTDAGMALFFREDLKVYPFLGLD